MVQVGSKKLALKNLKLNLENGNSVQRLRYLFVVVTTVVGVLFIIHILKFQTITSYRKLYMENPKSDYSHISGQVTQKLILMWTPYFNDWNWLKSNATVDICPLLKDQLCLITTDPQDLVDAHAVLFHWTDVKIGKIPVKKDSNQKWILVNYESPTNVKKNVATVLGKDIDWSVSYRLDSDFHSPYGRIRPKLPNESNLSWNELNEERFNRKGLIVWAVSHCHTPSQRENYVRLLKNNLTIEQVGTCGKPTNERLCTKGRNHRYECYRNMAKRYKFYLAFENALCKDYVTEKFFLPLRVGMVPVVMGGTDYSKIAPEGSYINALDFETPGELGEYITQVGDNFTLYQRYFEWKKKYVLDFADLTNPRSKSWLCDICSALHLTDPNPDGPGEKSKTKRNLVKWWFKDAGCWSWPLGWQTFLRQAQKRITNTLGGPLYKFIQG